MLNVCALAVLIVADFCLIEVAFFLPDVLPPLVLLKMMVISDVTGWQMRAC